MFYFRYLLYKIDIFPPLQRNVRLLLSPAPCAPHHWLLTMVSSGPANTKLRQQWRRRVAGRPGLKVVFLVANTTSAAAQAELEAEHEAEGDIVQCGVEDGHRLLGYKEVAPFTN